MLTVKMVAMSVQKQPAYNAMLIITYTIINVIQTVNKYQKGL